MQMRLHGYMAAVLLSCLILRLHVATADERPPVVAPQIEAPTTSPLPASPAELRKEASTPLAVDGVIETPPRAPAMSVPAEGHLDEHGLSFAASEAVFPDKLQDSSFDRYVDVMLAGQAVKAMDAGLLTDVALQLASAERILLRQHKAITSDDLLQLAIRIASANRDHQTLGRIKTSAATLGRPDIGKAAGVSIALMGAARSADQQHPTGAHR